MIDYIKIVLIVLLIISILYIAWVHRCNNIKYTTSQNITNDAPQKNKNIKHEKNDDADDAEKLSLLDESNMSDGQSFFGDD